MSITITIGITTKTINSCMEINEFTELAIKGCELTIFIFDTNTSNFHTYVFEYLQESELLPKKWLLHNIIYAITCDETKTNMDNLFNKFLDLLWYEYYLI